MESGSDIPSPRYELALSRKRPKNRIGLNRYYEDYSGEVTRVEDSPPACFEKRRLNIRYDRKLYKRVKFNKSYFACRQKVIPMSHATRFQLSVKAYFMKDNSSLDCIRKTEVSEHFFGIRRNCVENFLRCLNSELRSKNRVIFHIISI